MGKQTSGSEVGEERIDTGSGYGDYYAERRAKELWGKFIQGEISSQDLDQIVSGFKSANRKGL